MIVDEKTLMEAYLGSLLGDAAFQEDIVPIADPVVEKSKIVEKAATETMPITLLSFIFHGLEFAALLSSVDKVLPYEKPVVFVPGHPSWQLGFYQVGDENLRVIDVAPWLISQLNSYKKQEHAQEGRFLIRFADSRFAILCEEILDSVQVYPEDYKKPSGKKRPIPWLVGAMLDSMCPIIDFRMLEKAMLREKC